MIESGTFDELVAQGGHFAALATAQFMVQENARAASPRRKAAPRRSRPDPPRRQAARCPPSPRRDITLESRTQPPRNPLTRCLVSSLRISVQMPSISACAPRGCALSSKTDAAFCDLLRVGGKARRSRHDPGGRAAENPRPRMPIGRGRCVRPHARSRQSPVRMIRAAIPSPQSRVRRCVPPAPGSSPTLASGNPSFASCEAIRMSQARASSSPPPRACPSISAIVTMLKAAS